MVGELGRGVGGAAGVGRGDEDLAELVVELGRRALPVLGCEEWVGSRCGWCASGDLAVEELFELGSVAAVAAGVGQSVWWSTWA